MQRVLGLQKQITIKSGASAPKGDGKMYDCKEKICLYYDEDTRLNCERYHNTTACKGLTPLTTDSDGGAEVACIGGLSAAERDMEDIFALSLIRSIGITNPLMTKVLDEYKALMLRKADVLKEIRGT